MGGQKQATKVSIKRKATETPVQMKTKWTKGAEASTGKKQKAIRLPQKEFEEVEEEEEDVGSSAGTSSSADEGEEVEEEEELLDSMTQGLPNVTDDDDEEEEEEEENNESEKDDEDEAESGDEDGEEAPKRPKFTKQEKRDKKFADTVSSLLAQAETEDKHPNQRVFSFFLSFPLRKRSERLMRECIRRRRCGRIR